VGRRWRGGVGVRMIEWSYSERIVRQENHIVGGRYSMSITQQDSPYRKPKTVVHMRRGDRVWMLVVKCRGRRVSWEGKFGQTATEIMS
jgi:hypothetical protein